MPHVKAAESQPQTVQRSAFSKVSGLIFLGLLKNKFPSSFHCEKKIKDTEKQGKNVDNEPPNIHHLHSNMTFLFLFFPEVFQSKSQIALYFTTYTPVLKHSVFFFPFSLILENPNWLMEFLMPKFLGVWRNSLGESEQSYLRSEPEMSTKASSSCKVC